MYRSATIATLAATALATSGCGSFFYMGQHPSVGYEPHADHMDETLRSQIRGVTVVADTSRPKLRVDGDYGEQLQDPGEAARGGAMEGVQRGARAVGEEMVWDDPRTMFLLPLILPVAVLAGTVAGAAGAKIELELQRFRMGLSDEIATEDPDRPMPSDQLAEAFRAQLQAVDGVSLVAADADAEIKVAISEIEIVTDKSDAVIRTHAYAALTRDKDATTLYNRSFEYAERDSLRNWAADDAARWIRYADNARSYFAAEIAAHVFETINLRHVLRPAKIEGFSGEWSALARSSRPTLAWELFLLDGDEQPAAIDTTGTTFDLRIFDAGRLLYVAKRIKGTSHVVRQDLEDCQSLAWSVRPVYATDVGTRAGPWMSYQSNFDKIWRNEVLQDVPKTPEFWEYYAKLRTTCAS